MSIAKGATCSRGTCTHGHLPKQWAPPGNSLPIGQAANLGTKPGTVLITLGELGAKERTPGGVELAAIYGNIHTTLSFTVSLPLTVP